jgi:hypothetical protein
MNLTRFLHANRYPSSGQARGHASPLHGSSLLDQGRSALTVLRSVKTVKRQDGDYFAQAVEDGDAYPFTSQIGHFREHMAGQDGSVTKGVFEVFLRGLDGSRFVIRQVCDEVTATLHDNRMPRFGNRSYSRSASSSEPTGSQRTKKKDRRSGTVCFSAAWIPIRRDSYCFWFSVRSLDYHAPCGYPGWQPLHRVMKTEARLAPESD